MDRRIGWVAILAGSLIALAVQVAAPVGVPLYDGVVVQEPYRFLHPTGGQAGSPASYSQAYDLQAGTTPVIVAATTENPPQAQLIAQDDAFTVTPATTTVAVSITPIEPPPPPEGGTIAGNVYRFAIADQAGNPVALKLCQGCRSLLLRAPDGIGEATIKRYANGAWADVETVRAGTAGMYQTNPSALGDYAIVVGGSAQPAPGGTPGAPALDPALVLGGGALLVWLLIVAFVFWYRRRPLPPPGARAADGRARIPSKRKGPRRPPNGRSKQ